MSISIRYCERSKSYEIWANGNMLACRILDPETARIMARSIEKEYKKCT